MSVKKAAVDDNVLMQSRVSTAGSKILGNFTPPFNSAAISRLAEAGVTDIVQTKPNEFGASLTEGFGCVDCVARGEADVGIGCDMNGSIREKAAEAGLFFIKPTYGTVSRFGLVSTAPSMECIGIVCREVTDGFHALSLIAGADEKDGTLADAGKYCFSADDNGLDNVKIGVPSLCGDEMAEATEALTACGAEVEAFDFPLLGFVPAVAYIISAAETSNSISRFDGVKFGRRTEKYSNLEDMYLKTRTECFTFETKLFALAGMLVLSREKHGDWFEKAQKTRRLVKDAADAALEKYRILMIPAGQGARGQDGKYADFCSSYDSLKYKALPNLTGCPALSMPGGAQLMARRFDENILLRAGRCYQKQLGKEASR
ncbi:MAG: amidase family protein [Clostridiales bacterium]|nr:amidase family protein [Clostridiales bacterium]